NMYTESSYYTLGIIMFGLMYYLFHQLAQNFLLNNIWMPKKAVKIVLVSLIFCLVASTCLFIYMYYRYNNI
ncbi:hypothetical protein BHY29_08695, partial [Listeria monocytogenes]|nr:hypothetical protein [Listeria monocytogenes]MDB30490.1 hypothetical protein [Listeria monocytogenes]